MRWIILFSSIIFSVHVAFGQNAFPKYEGYKSLSSFSQDTVRYLQYNWGIKTGGLKTTRFFRIFDVVCICLIDYEHITKDAHEIS